MHFLPPPSPMIVPAPAPLFALLLPLVPGWLGWRHLQESAAMYLDTVNYEHLHIGQEAFLAHLAAAGIPEAHLELMQRRSRQQQAEAESEDKQQQQAAEAGLEFSGGGGSSGDGSGLEALFNGEGLAATTAPAAPALDGSNSNALDVLAGLQLTDEDALAAAASGPDSAQGSPQPATPGGRSAMPAAAAEGSRLAPPSEGGSLPPLTPPEARSPLVLAASAAVPASPLPGGSDTAAAAMDQGESGSSAGDGTAPRGLLFEAVDDTSVAQVAFLPVEQQQRQQQQEADGTATATSHAAPAPPEPLPPAALAVAAAEGYGGGGEVALIEEMIGEGTRHVLAAEAAGALQGRYPYMYAQAQDLSLVSRAASRAGLV